LIVSASDLPSHVKPDTAAGPLRFTLTDVVTPPTTNGLPLMPFFRLQDSRYQMYWELTTKEELAARHERLAAEERARARREANTLDQVAPGEQQPEVEHDYSGQNSDSGLTNGQRWRRGDSFQYTLGTRGEKAVDLVITCRRDDTGQAYDIFANGELLAAETTDNSQSNQLFEKRYSIPAKVLSHAANNRVTVKFSVKPGSRPARIFDVRLMKPDSL
jgi:hypothetical protein